ncbi:hypothetical protein ACFPYI_18665 [Halomarina salina]|uniref:MarR family transcriptional regulator n=1 Tax=Halomarina salina TaxID=1872699 RepID=A0ABD5RSC9_9EURY|nr:hypothetical protein [Halomarina salina]
MTDSGGTTTVDGDHDLVLRRVVGGEGDPETLADHVDRPRGRVESLLSDLVDDGLVEEGEAGQYEPTSSGRRLLSTDADDPTDDPDVPRAVDLVVASFDLDVDEKEALRRSLVFLRQWNSSTASELVDGVFDESPAGYDDPEAWWTDLVRDRLTALPGVVPPAEDETQWRYAGDDASLDEDGDGRRVLDRDGDAYGSARHAIEGEATDSQETEVLSALFESVVADDRRTADLVRVVAAETGSADDADRFTDSLAAIPGVERDGELWRYVTSDDGDESSDGA